MSFREPEIYNTYLRISRTARGQQWRPRKDFSEFVDTKEGYYLKRLNLFFDKFPQINIEDFFLAPFIIYKDEQYFGLNFFITQKAINAYSIYNKQKQEESPDTPAQLEFILDSVKFIGNYCRENGIQLTDYIDNKIGISYAFAIHYKHKKVSIYSLLYFPKFEKNVYLLEADERMLFFNSSSPDFSKFKTRYIISTKAKDLIQTAFKRISTFLKNTISSH
jgi:hypothetical protein